MSEQGEFYCDASPGTSNWYVWRKARGGDIHVAMFDGPHAEADAREHVAKCNARATEERKANEAQWPKFAASYVGSDGQGGETWRVIMNAGLPFCAAWVTEFYGKGAREGAAAFADRLNAAVQPEPPKPPPRFTIDARDGYLLIKDNVSGRWSRPIPPDFMQFGQTFAEMLRADAAGEGPCPT